MHKEKLKGASKAANVGHFVSRPLDFRIELYPHIIQKSNSTNLVKLEVSVKTNTVHIALHEPHVEFVQNED